MNIFIAHRIPQVFSEKAKIAVVFFICVACSRFWSFKGFPDRFYDLTEFAVTFFLAGSLLVNWRRISTYNKPFFSFVVLLLILPLVAMVPAYLYHDQSFALSLTIQRFNSWWMLYFLLHIYQVDRDRLIKVMLFIGFTWIILTVVQQFTYPIAFFYTRTDEPNADFFRAGLFRFMIDPYQYGLFFTMYFLWRYLQERKWQFALLFLMGVVGFYYYSTRQLMLGVVLWSAISILMQKGKLKYFTLGIAAIATTLLLVFSNDVLTDLIDMTVDQLNDKDDIRLLAGNFFLNDYWPNKICLVFGNGMEHLNSTYGNEIIFLANYFGYYKGDVGIIGAMNTYGLLYALVLVGYLVHACFVPVRYEDGYLKVVIFFTLSLLIITEQFSYPSAVPFYCCLFYLIEKSYSNRKLGL